MKNKSNPISCDYFNVSSTACSLMILLNGISTSSDNYNPFSSFLSKS